MNSSFVTRKNFLIVLTIFVLVCPDNLPLSEISLSIRSPHGNNTGLESSVRLTAQDLGDECSSLDGFAGKEHEMATENLAGQWRHVVRRSWKILI